MNSEIKFEAFVIGKSFKCSSSSQFTDLEIHNERQTNQGWKTSGYAGGGLEDK